MQQSHHEGKNEACSLLLKSTSCRQYKVLIFTMLFHAEDQILLDVQFHVRVDEAGANSQAWLSLFLSINTLFSVLFIIVVTKLDVLRSWKIRSVEMKIKVSTKRGKTIQV